MIIHWRHNFDGGYQAAQNFLFGTANGILHAYTSANLGGGVSTPEEELANNAYWMFMRRAVDSEDGRRPRKLKRTRSRG